MVGKLDSDMPTCCVTMEVPDLQAILKDSLMLCLFSYDEDKAPTEAFLRAIQYAKNKGMRVMGGYDVTISISVGDVLISAGRDQAN